MRLLVPVLVGYRLGSRLAEPDVARYVHRVAHVMLNRPIMYQMRVVDGSVHLASHTLIEDCVFTETKKAVVA